MNEQQIGDYKILKKIGAGGMARVYLAVHQDVPNLKVVLKVLTDSRLVERFKQEADKLALLDGHANICQIKHFFNHGEDIVIAMEYIDGTTLEEMMKGRGRMEMGESLQIIDDVLTTLEFAHKKKICHRDIKPSNIMIDNNGQVKIIDFGIAKAETDPDLTIAGSAVGTPAYMAPEQFTPTERTNYEQIDIYAVGTTLYYMLTGELPFKGDNQFVLREAKLFSMPTKPRDINREIPRQLENIIMKSLERETAERFQTAVEMRCALTKIPREEQIAGETEYVDKAGRKKSKGGTSRLAKRMSVGAFILVGAIAIYLIFFRPSEDKPLVAPELYSPGFEAVLNTSLPQFAWQSTADEGGGYNLQYSADSNFSDSQIISNLTINRYRPDDSLADGKYFWRVQTIDKDDIKSTFSEVFTFTVETIPEEIPRGSLELTVRPSGDIYIDGELYGRNQKSAELTLDTGRHVVIIRNNESIEKVFDVTIPVNANSKTTRSFSFTFPEPESKQVESEKKPEETFGRLSVGSKPLNGALIFIDDRLQDQRTPYTFRLKAGRHAVRTLLTLDGREMSQTDTVLIAIDSTSKVIFDFED